MTQRPTLPPGLPPRLLTREQAAAYVGLSVTAFDAEILAGTFPGAAVKLSCRRRLFDRKALDDVIDRLSGRVIETKPASYWLERLDE